MRHNSAEWYRLSLGRTYNVTMETPSYHIQRSLKARLGTDMIVHIHMLSMQKFFTILDLKRMAKHFFSF